MSLSDRWEDNPFGMIVGAVSLAAIVGGIGIGAAKGSFSPDPQQLALESREKSEKIREQQAKMANARFDAGCEGVFYFKPKTSIYQPLTEGTGVISGAFWHRWQSSKAPKPKPSATDYLPAGTVVCDGYGNAGVLVPSDKGFAVVSDLVNTPDRSRINKMMSRYPEAKRPQVGQ